MSGIRQKIVELLLKLDRNKTADNRRKILEELAAILAPEYMPLMAKNVAGKSLDKRFNELAKVAQELVPEYKLKWPYVDWWESVAFSTYLEDFDEDAVFNADRRWMLAQLIRLTDGVVGDTAECGVYSGSSSWLICNYNKSLKTGRSHLMFDSFAGLSEPGERDGDHWIQGDLEYPFSKVKENLSEFVDVEYYPGWIPERFSEVESRRFSFVHVDVDLYQPTLDCVEFFYPRLNDGGLLVCDDYGSSLCPGATEAVNEFLTGKPENMISLSGVGGAIIKGKKCSREIY